MKIKLKNDWRILSIVVLFITLGVIFRPFMYLAVLLLFILLYVSSDEKIISSLFFLFPYATMFKISPGSTSLFTIIEIIALCRIIIRNKISRSFVSIWIVYVGYVIMGMGLEFTDGIKQILLPLLIYFILKFNDNNNLYRNFEYYTVSMIISSILGYFRLYIPNLTAFIDIKQDHLGNGEYVSRFAGLWGDPNYYTVNLILCLTFIVYFLSKKIISIKKAIILSVPLIVFGALTGSKSFFLMLGVVSVIMIINLFIEKRYILCMLSILLITIVGIMIFNGDIPIFDAVLKRFASTKGDITTGRAFLWNKYLVYMLEHPIKLFIGNGLGSGYTFTAPHSIYIDYLDFYGVIGTSIFLITIYSILKRYRKMKSILSYMPIICLLIMYANLSMIRYLDYGFQLAIGLSLIYKYKEIKGYEK